MFFIVIGAERFVVNSEMKNGSISPKKVYRYRDIMSIDGKSGVMVTRLDDPRSGIPAKEFVVDLNKANYFYPLAESPVLDKLLEQCDAGMAGIQIAPSVVKV